MTIKLLLYKWTFLCGVAFLGSLLWSVTFCNGLSDLFFFVFLMCFVVSLVASVVIGVTRRSKDALYRILINVIFCLLLFPTIRLGGSLRDRLFLTHLSRFQEVTDLLIQNEMNSHDNNIYTVHATLPSSYSNLLNVKDMVIISSKGKNFTVRYATRNSNALWHGGYMYRSDDNPAALSKEYPTAGYTRIAPHWFFFSQ